MSSLTPRIGVPVTAAGFDIDPGTPQWWPREARGHTFAEVTAHADSTIRGGPANELYGSVAFTAHSPYCAPLLRRGVVTLFRDSHGTLLGGAFAPDGLRGPDPAARQMCYSGAFTGRTHLDRIPTEADDGRTEIHLYCDIAEPPLPAPSSSTAPIN